MEGAGHLYAYRENTRNTSNGVIRITKVLLAAGDSRSQRSLHAKNKTIFSTLLGINEDKTTTECRARNCRTFLDAPKSGKHVRAFLF
jgi:hypothetical protein